MGSTVETEAAKVESNVLSNKFFSTTVGHFVVMAVGTFVAGGISAVSKDTSLTNVFAGSGILATLLVLARDLLDGSVPNA